jgi:hypothetical protein
MNTNFYKWSKNILNVQRIFEMSIKYINNFQSKALKIFPTWKFWFENKPSGNPHSSRSILGSDPTTASYNAYFICFICIFCFLYFVFLYFVFCILYFVFLYFCILYIYMFYMFFIVDLFFVFYLFYMFIALQFNCKRCK